MTGAQTKQAPRDRLQAACTEGPDWAEATILARVHARVHTHTHTHIHMYACMHIRMPPLLRCTSAWWISSCTLATCLALERACLSATRRWHCVLRWAGTWRCVAWSVPRDNNLMPETGQLLACPICCRKRSFPVNYVFLKLAIHCRCLQNSFSCQLGALAFTTFWSCFCHAQVMPPFPEDRFLCAFGHIFAGGYSAGYFSYK